MEPSWYTMPTQKTSPHSPGASQNSYVRRWHGLDLGQPTVPSDKGRANPTGFLSHARMSVQPHTWRAAAKTVDNFRSNEEG
jgi:hypothetical protein